MSLVWWHHSLQARITKPISMLPIECLKQIEMSRSYALALVNTKVIVNSNSISLDEFIENNSEICVDDVSMVWMDIQGHEGKFLQGAYGFLSKQKIPVVMEFWPYGLLRSGTTKEEFLSIIKKLFTHFYIVDKELPGLKEISQVESLFDESAKTPSGGYNLAFVNKN